MSTSDNLIAEQAYKQGYENGFKDGMMAAERIIKVSPLPSCDSCANCPKAADIKAGGVYPVCTFWPDCVRNGFRNWRVKEV